MKQDRPHLVTSEVSKNLPILIIDKKGVMGQFLAAKLKSQFLVVLVTGQIAVNQENVVHVPFKKKIPTIPDNSYSHIFVFYNGEAEILEILPMLVRKGNETNGKIFFLTTLIYSSEALFKRLSAHLYHSLGIILYGEVFDENIRLGNMVNLFIYQSRKSNRLEIPNEGVGKLYPVYVDDLLIVIIATAFSHELSSETVFAFPKYPFTEISVARIFQKLNPDLKIDFNKRRIRNMNYFIPENGKHAFSNYRLEDGLRKINLLPVEGFSKERQSRAPKPTSKTTYNLRLGYILILAALVLPVILAVIFGILGASLAGLSLKTAEKGEFLNASHFASLGSGAFAVSKTITANYLPAEILARNEKNKLLLELDAGQEGAEMEVSIFYSLNKFANVFNGKSADPKTDFEGALSNVKNTLLRLEEMKAQDMLPDIIKSKLDKTSYLTSLFENTSDTLPQILGINGKKKYLILFQNNMELRPGGGFIGSYAILNMDRGHIGDFKIHDVYDADGKLKTHVEPPYGLRRYGGVTHLFLRDTNFDVDFTADTESSTDMLYRETGEKVDGVIAIDTSFIKNIIAALGNVRVDDYKEDVNSSNFYLLTQKHVENNFFPGSTQKKDFLRALLSSMLVRLSEHKNISYINILQAVEKSIKEKHVLFAFKDQSVQDVFSANNLSSNMWDKRTSGENVINDSFGVVDANIGANKSNYYLLRSISQDVTISTSGVIEETSTVKYENTSKKDSVFGGDYKNYVRFVLPEGAVLKGINIDGNDIPTIPAVIESSIVSVKNFVPPKELEIESTKVNGKEVIAFFIIVPAGGTKNIAISYMLSTGVNTNSPSFVYDLRVFKQPGTDEDPLSVVINYPPKFKPLDLGRDAVDLGGRVKYEVKLNEDRDMRVGFSQK